MPLFSWDDWNIQHIATHGVSRDEAEYIVRHAVAPFPRGIGDMKELVWGQTIDGRFLQVIFVYKSGEEIDYESVSLEDLITLEESDEPIVYIIHAMDMTARMKQQYRRLRK